MEAGLGPKPVHAASALTTNILPTGAAALRLPHRELLPFPLNGPPRTPQSSRGSESPGLAERTKGETAGKASSVKSGVHLCASRKTESRVWQGGCCCRGGVGTQSPLFPPRVPASSCGGAGGGENRFKSC